MCCRVTPCLLGLCVYFCSLVKNKINHTLQYCERAVLCLFPHRDRTQVHNARARFSLVQDTWDSIVEKYNLPTDQDDTAETFILTVCSNNAFVTDARVV